MKKVVVVHLETNAIVGANAMAAKNVLNNTCFLGGAATILLLTASSAHSQHNRAD